MLGSLFKKFLSPQPAPQPQQQIDTPAVSEPVEHPWSYDGKIIVSFIGNSRSDGLASGAHAVAQICRAEGYDYRLIDMREDGWSEQVDLLVSRPEEVCCILSTMGMAVDWVTNTPDGPKPLWGNVGIPFLSTYGDHPAYYWDCHQPHGRGYAGIYAFQEHLDAALAWISPQPQVGILPPFARDVIEKGEIDFGAKQSGKIFFFKNGNDPQQLLDFWKTLPQPISGWLMEISHSFDMLKVGRGLPSLHVLLRDYLRERQIYPGHPAWFEVFIVAQLDDYARRLKSTLMARALLDMPVHIFGDNWGHVDFTGRRATYSAGQSYFQSRELVKDALAVLDMSPNTESSPHERFMGAIGRYTLCLNNTQKYYLDNYPEAERMLFDFDEQSLRQRVSDVLAHPARHVDYGVAVAEHGRMIHSSAKVVAGLADFARLTRLSNAASSFAGQERYVNWPARSR